MIYDKTMTVAVCDLCTKLGPSAETAKTLTGNASIQTVEKLLPDAGWIKTALRKIICDECIAELNMSRDKCIAEPKAAQDAFKMGLGHPSASHVNAATANKLVDAQRDAINDKGTSTRKTSFKINGWAHTWEHPTITKEEILELYARDVPISPSYMRDVALVICSLGVWSASVITTGAVDNNKAMLLEDGMYFTVQFPSLDSSATVNA
jgi:hypothetical protein